MRRPHHSSTIAAHVKPHHGARPFLWTTVQCYIAANQLTTYTSSLLIWTVSRTAKHSSHTFMLPQHQTSSYEHVKPKWTRQSSILNSYLQIILATYALTVPILEAAWSSHWRGRANRAQPCKPPWWNCVGPADGQGSQSRAHWLILRIYRSCTNYKTNGGGSNHKADSISGLKSGLDSLSKMHIRNNTHATIMLGGDFNVADWESNTSRQGTPCKLLLTTSCQ